MAIALVIALLLGVWLGHLHRGSFVAINVSNIGRALPSLALIAFGVALLGIGFVNVMVALVVLAIPPMLTNAYVAVDGVDPDAVEAAQGMGMTPTEVLLRVELPLALPLIFAGVRTAVVYVIATATLAPLAGASSLGDIIVDQATYRLPGVLGAAICVAVLALVAELLFAAAAARGHAARAAGGQPAKPPRPSARSRPPRRSCEEDGEEAVSLPGEREAVCW